MTTYNTGNALGSTDPKDLYDNAENLDRAVNDRSSDRFTDRLGQERLTWEGMTRLSNLGAAVEAAERAEDAADRAAMYDNLLSYVTKSEMDDDTSQPVGSIARVSTGEGAGDYVMTSGGWVLSNVQPVSRSNAFSKLGRIPTGSNILDYVKTPGVYSLAGGGAGFTGVPDDPDWTDNSPWWLFVYDSGDGYDGSGNGEYPYLHLVLVKQIAVIKKGVSVRPVFSTRFIKSTSEILPWTNETRTSPEPDDFDYQGYYIRASDGSLRTTANASSASDYKIIADVDQIEVYGRISTNVSLVAFYDHNKQFISAIAEGEINAVNEYRIINKTEFPKNAYYIRATGIGDSGSGLLRIKSRKAIADFQDISKKSLFDLSDLISISGSYRTSDGDVFSRDGHKCTPKIPVRAGDRFLTTTSVVSDEFIINPAYDADGNVIDGFDSLSHDFVVTQTMWDMGVRSVAFSYRAGDEKTLEYSPFKEYRHDSQLSDTTGYWLYGAPGGYVEDSTRRRVGPIPVEVGDWFRAPTSVVSDSTIQNPLFNAAGEMLTITFDGESPDFVVTQEMWAAGVRSVGFSYNQADSKTCIQYRAQDKAGNYSARLVSLEGKVGETPPYIPPALGISGIIMAAASLASPTNGWFELAVKRLNVNGYNKAVNGTQVNYHANRMWRGTFCTDAEFEDADVLVLQFANVTDLAETADLLPSAGDYVAGFDINDPSNQFNGLTHAQQLDYILKYWQERCYAQRNVSGSKWEGTQHGKPFRVMFLSSWHDSRPTYTEDILALSERWGAAVCRFDQKIGFSINQPLPDGTQVSTLYAMNNQIAGGVEVGWHPLLGQDEYIQQRLGSIFSTAIREFYGWE